MNADNIPGSKPEGFMDHKITKANFNIDPEHTLKPKQYERVVRFLRWHNPPSTLDIVDAIVVPTTSPNFDLASFNKRITAAIEYSSLYPQATVVFAGKRPDLSRATLKERQDEYSEAEVMADAAINKGLDKGRVLLEELSFHTGQNISNSLDLLIARGLILRGLVVTSSSYMARRINYYLINELRIRDMTGKINPYTFDADVAEDLNGDELSSEETERKRRSILYEAKRLSQYRHKGDL